jgi:hypothetical protein
MGHGCYSDGRWREPAKALPDWDKEMQLIMPITILDLPVWPAYRHNPSVYRELAGVNDLDSPPRTLYWSDRYED